MNDNSGTDTILIGTDRLICSYFKALKKLSMKDFLCGSPPIKDIDDLTLLPRPWMFGESLENVVKN